MKLYVEEQDMPPNCAECEAEGHYENSYGDEYGFFCPFGYKEYTSGTRDTKRLDDCPFVSVPPHGDLIDRDALMKGEGRYIISFGKEGIDVAEIERTPTVIPASELDRILNQ